MRLRKRCWPPARVVVAIRGEKVKDLEMLNLLKSSVVIFEGLSIGLLTAVAFSVPITYLSGEVPIERSQDFAILMFLMIFTPVLLILMSVLCRSMIEEIEND